MLYFAYGSNLNHFQMRKRCKDSKYIKKFEIKDFRLTFRSKLGVADIESKKNYYPSVKNQMMATVDKIEEENGVITVYFTSPYEVCIYFIYCFYLYQLL